jgi:hypothetical protein
MLLNTTETAVNFPPHGVVSVISSEEGAAWRELWRIGQSIR